VRADQAEPVPDLVQRNFKAEAPNQLWLADFTYVPTLAGFLFLAVVLDAFSRRVIGWAMGPRPTMQLVIEALDMAIWNRRADPGVIHHSDHGSQYTSLTYGRRNGVSAGARSRWDARPALARASSRILSPRCGPAPDVARRRGGRGRRPPAGTVPSRTLQLTAVRPGGTNGWHPHEGPSRGEPAAAAPRDGQPSWQTP
jgi:hypothetical protein